MNKIYKYFGLLSILALAISTSAQVEEDDVIVDTQKVKIIVKEKKIITQSENGSDTVVSREVQRIEMDGEDSESVDENVIVIDGDETGYQIIKTKKEGEEGEDYMVIIGGDTISSESSIKHVIKVMKDMDEGSDNEVFVFDGEDGPESLEEMIELELEELFEEDEDEEPPFVETDWFNMQWGFNNLINSNDKLEMPVGSELMELDPGKSANFQVHVVQQALNIYKGKVRFVYGVGVDWNNYRFKNDIDIFDSMPTSAVVSMNDYKKNKLVSRYLTVPTMLDFTFGQKDDDGFKLAFGANFGYNIGNHLKQKWEDGSGKNKTKTRGDYNFEQFRMGYEVQFGYGSFILYGKYFPNSIFNDGGGPDLRSVSAGILIGHI